MFENKKVLILEGGGFKTSFSAGVMDAFQMQSHNPFDTYIGVSGGCIAISYFLSKKYGYFYGWHPNFAFWPGSENDSEIIKTFKVINHILRLCDLKENFEKNLTSDIESRTMIHQEFPPRRSWKNVGSNFFAKLGILYPCYYGNFSRN